MRLYKEIADRTGLKELFSGKRCVWLVGGGAYFQGVKTLAEYSAEKIVLFFSSGALTLSGEKLTVEKYLDGDVEIGGKIFSLDFEENGKPRLPFGERSEKSDAEKGVSGAKTGAKSGENAR